MFLYTVLYVHMYTDCITIFFFLVNLDILSMANVISMADQELILRDETKHLLV